MEVNHCIILAAGFGTRMGEIGNHLPKILWPVFEKTLLELQIKFAKKMGISNIFINTHYQSNLIHQFLKDNNLDSQIIVLNEPELLGVGGAVHNVARHPVVNYSGNLLILNCDQFIFFNKQFITESLKKLSNNTAILFTTTLENDSSYSEIGLDNQGHLKEIIRPPKSPKHFLTYSGSSIVNLSKLDNILGFSKFFESVANYQMTTIPTMETQNLKYWDFGTFERYYTAIYKIAEHLDRNDLKEPFIQFLIENQAIFPNKFSKIRKSYNAGKEDNLLNFSSFQTKNPDKYPSVVLEGTNDTSINGPGVYWRDLVQKF